MADNKKKKKLESNFINMFSVLTVIGLVSALALGFTYNKTKKRIDQIKKQKLEDAIGDVLPEFDTLRDTVKLKKKPFKGFELFPAEKNGEHVGTAVKAISGKGFSGKIKIMVGFDTEGTVVNTAVLEHAETPGLGAKMETDAFREQFRGAEKGNFTLAVKKDGGDVDAITASTITSRAFCDAVKKARTALEKGGSE